VTNRDLLNEDDSSASNAVPSLANPGVFNITIKQNVQMRNSTLRKFHDADIIRRNSILSAQVLPEFVEDGSHMANGVLFIVKLRGIESER
jgi:hypothetical protein